MVKTLLDAADLVGVAQLRCQSRLLLYAARHGRADIARLAIANGADVNFKGPSILHVGDQFNPLLLATRHGHVEIAELLIERGVLGDANEWCQANDHCPQLDRQPLYHAASRGYVRVAERLLDGGVNINMYDSKNHLRFTWMYAAAETGECEVMRILLQRGFDLHAGNGRAGTTAAKIAAKNGYESAVKLLIEAGVRPSTVAECAKKWKQWDVHDMLLQRMGKSNLAPQRKRASSHVADNLGRRKKSARQ